MTEKNTEQITEETKPKKGMRLLTVAGLVLLLLYILAIISHDVNDLALIEGGLGNDGTEANWIGNIGAHIARAMFYLFGLAVYPVAVILVIAGIRTVLPFPLKRQGYVGSLLSIAVGIILLMAMYPAQFQEEAERVGIGRMLHPEMCLTGGTMGAVFAAPKVVERGIQLEAGLLRRHIGETGTLVVALAFLLTGLYFVFMQDWFPMILASLRKEPMQTAPPEPEEEPEPIPEPVVEPEPLPPPPSAPASNGKLSFADRFKVLVTGKPVGEVPAPEVTETPVPEPAQMTTEPIPAEEPYEEEPPAVAEDIPEEEPVIMPPPPAVKNTAAVRPPPAVTQSAAPRVTQFSDEKKKYDNEKPAVSTGTDGGNHFSNGLDYTLPPVALLDKQAEDHKEDTAHIEQSRERLQQTMESFNVEGHVGEIVVGPRVTRFEIALAAGVKVEKVSGIQNNIAMDLAAESIRILAPIPGKNMVGIEVPNKVSSMVYIRSLMESAAWRENKCQIPIVLGRDIAGKVVVADLAKAPHLLIAGSTGSGKSVCMNTLIMSLLFKFSPAELRLIMVDPKVVELEMYRPIPHLITPVVNDPKKVPLALRWGVNEMERRYRVMAKVKAKGLESFNRRPQDPAPVLDEDGNVIPQTLPLVIIIIDELADIMMTEAKSDVETSICRIAQKGRAAGIHLVIATQTPRKDIITGLIKANLPSKIAFRVGSNMDSRVILDCGGAERLLGKGDMLFNQPGAAGLVRIQGAMVSDAEIQKVTDFVSGQVEQHFDAQVMADDVQVHSGENDDEPAVSRSSREDQYGEDVDDIIGDLPGDEFINSCAAKYLRPGDSDLLRKALEIIIMEQKASTSYLQRRLGIGYNKSAELMDQLEDRGIISAPLPGGQKRNILITDGLEENHIDM